MEASALHAPVGLARQRSTIGLAVLRLRSDEQLVALLRAGHEEAFGVIHDRYHARLFAYMRQMLSLRQDVEDALQEVFERAYSSLLTGDRELALRPWLYRIAHNRCIDHLRRPIPPPPEAMLQLGSPPADPIIVVDRREALRRLMDDVRRLPDQQRSALLMRELGGISYAEVAQALGVTVPAVKSLLVRARISLAQAVEARDTACTEIQAELVLAHEGRVRPNAMARRHLRDCPGCREFRGHLRGVRRQLLALGPSVGMCGLVARVLGGGGGSSGAAGSGAAAAVGGSAVGLAGGATAIGGGGGILASAGALVTSAGHVATLIAATVVTAGGAAALQHSIAPVLDPHHAHKPAHVRAATRTSTASTSLASGATALAVTDSLTSPTRTTLASTAHSASAAAQSGHRVHRIVVGSGADGLLPTPDPTPPAGAITTASGATKSVTGGLTGSATSLAGGATSSAGTGTSTGTGTGTGSSGAGSGTASSGAGSGTGSGSSASATGSGSGSGTATSGSGSTGAGTTSGTGSASSGSAGTGTGSTGTGSTGSGQGAGVSGTSGSSTGSSSSYPYTT